MKNYYIIIFYFLLINSYFIPQNSIAQLSPVSVCNQELKIAPAGFGELYFAFAEGDKMAVSIREKNSNKIEALEITEYPSKSLYNETKFSVIEKVSIPVVKKSIVRFYIKNSLKQEIICNIIIERIPESAQTKDFNTAVKWVEKQDTSYKNLPQKASSVDTSSSLIRSRELVKTELKENILIDKNFTLNPKGISAPDKKGTDKIVVLLQLPKNENTRLQTKTLKGWAYWIGCGKEGDDVFAGNVEKYIATNPAFTNPLSAYAIGQLDAMNIPKKGDLIEYYIMNSQLEANRFTDGVDFGYLDKGKGVAGFGSNNAKGSFYIGVKNDNQKEVGVTIKVSAVFEVKTYVVKEKKNMEINKSKNQQVSTKQMIIKTIKVPTFSE